jgi:hypothetical protein
LLEYRFLLKHSCSERIFDWSEILFPLWSISSEIVLLIKDFFF